MPRTLLFLLACMTVFPLSAQTNICNPGGNLMIFTNYDGGYLNINVDQNIPNLKIGVVSYEAVYITLSGTFVNNVTDVVYAGYNATNNHCGSTNLTSISGAPTGANTAIQVMPAAGLSNPNGYAYIICGYSCSTTSSQGGCNTVDQIEDYFLNYFSGSVLYAHKAQYGCWSGTQSISSGGTCCATVTPLTLTLSKTDEGCQGDCDGSITPSVTGGTPPYSYSGTASFNNLCAGNYTVIVTDNTGATDTATITVGTTTQVVPPTGSQIQKFCAGATVADLVATGTSLQWFDVPVGGNPLPSGTPLTNINYYCSQFVNGCESISRLEVAVQVVAVDVTTTVQNFVISANATGATYQWIDCNAGNVAIPLATGKNYWATHNGSYAVIVTVDNCSDTSACVPVTGIGIAENGEHDLIKIYPSPASQQLIIEAGTSWHGEGFAIHDITGRLVLHGLLHRDETAIDVSALAPGSYILKVATLSRAFYIQR